VALILALSALPSVGTGWAEEGKPKEGAVEGPVFVKLPPIVLPVFSGNRVARQAGLVLALELEPGKTEAELEPNRRKLYDAFIADLYDLYDQLGAANRVIEPTVIKQRLFATSERILGPGFVHEVLIEQAFERPRG
jgi:hypothetical protein